MTIERRKLKNAKAGDLLDARKFVISQNLFFNASFDITAKYFLKQFEEFENVFEKSFSEIRSIYCSCLQGVNTDIPLTEDEFYKYINREFLYLEMEPYKCLLRILTDAHSDIKKITQNIKNCEKKLRGKKAREKSEESTDEESKYRAGMLKHYIEVNNKAKSEIVDLIINQEEIRNAAHYRAQISIAGFNQQPLYSYRWNPETYDINNFSEISNKFLDLGIREHRKLRKIFEDAESREEFQDKMNTYIKERKVVEKIYENLDKNRRLADRKYILKPALDEYRKGNKSVFLHLATSQVEGIFFDYCSLMGISEDKLDKSGIGEKLDKLRRKGASCLYSFEYFKFIFPIIRNKIAHGRIMKEGEIEYQADFLLLDLLDVTKSLISEELEIKTERNLNQRYLRCLDAYQQEGHRFSLLKLAYFLTDPRKRNSQGELDIKDIFEIDDESELISIRNRIDEIEIFLKKKEFSEILESLIRCEEKTINAGIKKILSALKKKQNELEYDYIKLFKAIEENYVASNQFSETQFLNTIDEIAGLPF